MSININSTSSIQTNDSTAVGIKTAQKAKGQQELEGQMALNLIQSAAIVPPPSGNAGNTVNIKV